MKAGTLQANWHSRARLLHNICRQHRLMVPVNAAHDEHSTPHFHAPPCAPSEAAAWEAVFSRHNGSSTVKASNQSEATAGPSVKTLGPGVYEADEWSAVLSSKRTSSHGRASPSSSSQPLQTAVVIGSQSLMAVVMQGTVELARICDDTTLGHGLQPGQHLSPDGVASATNALSQLGSLINRFTSTTGPHTARQTRVVGTAALRECADPSIITAAVRQHLQADLEVISGEEEGVLSFLGATGGLPSGGPALVIDLGSRSCELAAGTVGARQAADILSVSIPLGCKGIMEHSQHTGGAGDTAATSLQERARAVLHAHSQELQLVRQRLADLCSIARSRQPHRNPAAGVDRLQVQTGCIPQEALVVLTGGTATTLQALQLPEYTRAAVHYSHLTPAELELLMQEAVPEVGRYISVPWLSAQRRTTLQAGAIALYELLFALGQPADRPCVISDADLLDGLLMSLL